MEHDVLEYKGYTTKVKVDLRKGRIYGKVLGIVDAVNDECTSASEVEERFTMRWISTWRFVRM